MKKLIILIAFLGIGILTFSQEWVNVNEKDYKLIIIDTVQLIVVADGYYDIQITPEDTTITYEGGFGNYFFYKGEEKNVNLSDEIINNLKIKTYGIKEDEL